MKVKPIGERVLIEPVETEEKTAGGIYIPDTAKEKTNEGKVLAVGDAKDMPVKVNDRIMYESFSGSDVNVDGKKLMINYHSNCLSA